MPAAKTLEVSLMSSAKRTDTFRNYYILTKPGIVYSNAMTAAAGFLLAADGNISFKTLVALLAGTSFVIAAACICNNYLDRDIDKKMSRTKKRALASRIIPARNAFVLAGALLALGFWSLSYVNRLVMLLGAAAFVSYVFIYTFSKRHTVHGTLLGTLPGAASLVAGYSALSGKLDGGSLILFLIMVAWQMPHFYAIAIRRLDDYKAAKIPVMPAVKGIRATKFQMIFYVILFGVATTLLSVLGYAGASFLVVMLLLSLYWLWLGLKGFNGADNRKWAGKMFGFSLVLLLALSLMLSVNSLLP